jgi:hypothetical protein
MDKIRNIGFCIFCPYGQKIRLKEFFMKRNSVILLAVFLLLGATSVFAFGGKEKSGTSGNSGGTTAGGDKRADLAGYWVVEGAYYPTSFNLEEDGNGGYLLEMTGGGGNESYISLVSYDGNTAVAEYDGETKTFTAKIQGNKLTISDWNTNYNGTYTKQE